MGSEKGAGVELECDVGLGLKMQQRSTNQSFPGKKMMMTTENNMLPYYYHHPRLSSSSGGGGGFGCNTDADGGVDGGGGGGCSIYGTGSKQVGCMGDVYDVVGAGSGLTLPPTPPTFKTFSSSSSSGIAAAAAVRGVPFSAVQLQELERQTIVYNYMRASIPIPSELLVPTTKSVPKSNRLWDMGCINNNGSDAEPWRCRRTDGKKWRCSRDVAPDQKYCERHTHKNKPRSRKPVEVQQSHHSSITNNKNRPNLQHMKPQQFLNQTDHHHHHHVSVSPYPTLQVSATTTPYEQQSRYSDWFLKGGTGSAAVASSNQQWQHQPQQHQLMQSMVGLKRDSSDCYKNVCNYGQQHEESMNVNDQCSLFLGPKMVSLEGALNLGHTERPRDFIDAWSTAERDGINEIRHNHKCYVSSTGGKLPLSSLTLSMPGDNQTHEDDENAEMGMENAVGSVKSQSLLNWTNPGSWMSSGSTPGGPLAEALCLGMGSSTRAVSNPESPHGCNSSNSNSSHGKSPSGDGSQGFNLM